MTRLAEKIAFNSCGVHIVGDTTPVTAAAAGCDDFRAVKAIGGDVVIASFGSADITGVTTGITITNGDTLLVRFKEITLTSGVAALTKYKA
jgi:hypothetical protein